MEHQELLAKLGLRIEPFGGDTILVSSYPAMLSSVGVSEVLHGLLEPLMAGGKEPDSRALLDELLNTIACKAAVKAGDYLTPDEIDSLLDQRHLVALVGQIQRSLHAGNATANHYTIHNNAPYMVAIRVIYYEAVNQFTRSPAPAG